MEIKDVKMKLKVKSNKVTKILHLLLADAIADFQKGHPKSIPSLLSALKKGDTEKAIDNIDHLLDLVDDLRDSVESVRNHIINSMPPVHKDEKFGGKSFIDPDGNRVHKIGDGDPAVIASSKGVKL
jgi:hypothetical protein